MQLDVKAFMTGHPMSIGPETSALEALDLMVEHAIRHLPVVDGEGRVCGVVSFDDLRAALPVPLSLKRTLAVEERHAVSDYAIGEIMSYPPVTLGSGQSLEDAVTTMLERRVSCLPVLDGEGGLEGILTETDLLRALATVLWTETRRGQVTLPVPDDLVTSLEKEAAHLRSQLEAFEDDEQEFTQLRRDTPLDSGEVGAHAEATLLTGQLATMASRRLRAIEEALERAERGELDVCESCGGRIAARRLRALPSARLCIDCAREAERGGRSR